jgi:hypothetical protein
MIRCRIINVVTLLTASALWACGFASVYGQDYRQTPRRRTVTAERRAGSVGRESQLPAYQRPIFDPPPRMGSAEEEMERAEAAPRKLPKGGSGQAARPVAEYFDPTLERKTAKRRTSVNRAAYQGTKAAPSLGAGPKDSAPLTSVVPEDLGMPVQEGPMVDGGMMPYDSAMAGGDCADGSCGGCESCGGYGDICDPCDSCPDWYPGKDLTLFAGVQGFKNAVDEGQNGNFGFHEGVNWSSPFWNAAGVGFQAGFQALQSDFSSSAFFTNDRSQYFLTTGFFRRQFCDYGWQWGVVYDHLFDEFADKFDVGQIRGEVSYKFYGHEFGYWFATGASDDLPGPGSVTGVTTYETLDLHAIFYRRRLMNGGEGRLWGGVTGDSDGMFGGDIRVPVACDWDLMAAFNYISPNEDQTADGSFRESWNIGINLVWYVCPQGALQAAGSQYRPLFNVADNGTLIVNTLR